jgi:hypothetical protein
MVTILERKAHDLDDALGAIAPAVGPGSVCCRFSRD